MSLITQGVLDALPIHSPSLSLFLLHLFFCFAFRDLSNFQNNTTTTIFERKAFAWVVEKMEGKENS
jgi:hypothetical protein